MVERINKYYTKLGWGDIMPPVLGTTALLTVGLILYLFLTVDQTIPAASAYSLIWEE